jgi:colicin import membrane protein
MGREAKITYEQVAAAADAMKVAGGKPTSRAIRERLGNTGSMGTINKLLQDWRAGQERQMANALALPAALQRAILEFMDQELRSAKATLAAELAEQQQEAFDLATENERQAFDIEEKNDATAALQANLATLQGRIDQMETDLATARNDAFREREAAEAARIELAKVLLRLETMLRLEADLATLRLELDKEWQGRVSAEQQAAVLAAKLDAATERATKAEAAVTLATAQVHKSGEAMALEARKAETAQNKVANLTGKLDAMQAQIARQAHELDATRQEAKKASEEAAELRGKHAGNAKSEPIKK